MAISININTDNTNQSYANEVVYRRLYNQTPADFAVSYLEKIEDLFAFYRKFNMKNYEDFYTLDKYRIANVDNPMKLNNKEAITKTPLSPIDDFDYSIDYSIDYNS